MLTLNLTLAVALLSNPGAPMSQIPVLKFEKYTLPNGLDVILYEDHSTPIVGVNVWYHVGSKNERPGRTGFAHLFEHMMFQGSKHYDKVYFGPLQAVGGRLNGSTSMDRTNYWETVPSNHLELALWMESDRMGFLLPAMTQTKLDNQRDVVKNERRQSYENRPYGLVYETMLAAMYPADHPYSWPTIGSMKDIGAASREDIADFFRRYYHPGNASLCVAGDFDPKEAKQLVAKYFGPIPAGPKVQQPAEATPKLAAEQRIRMTDHVGLARLYMAWPAARQFTQTDAELDVLAHVLSGSKVSRLYKTLVRDRQIAQDVQAHQQALELTGQFMVVATARPGHTLEEIEKAIAEEVRRLQNEPPTADEVAQAVNSFESQFIRSLESISEFWGRADRLNMYNVMTGDPGYMQKDFARYRLVTPESVRRAAAEYLGAGRVVVEVQPGAKLSIEPDPRQGGNAARDEMASRLPPLPPIAPTVTSDETDRQSLPGGTKEPAFCGPTIQRARLSNGMEVLLVERNELPLVTLHAVFPVGRARGFAGRPGLADMMTAVWDEGTDGRTAEQISAELMGIGANLSVGCDWDTTGARLFTLKRHLGRALDIYADVLRHPAFPTEELERQRIQALGRLTQVRNEPLSLAPMAASQLLYGIDHPYGQPQYGSPSGLKQITPAELKEAYRHQIRPEQATIIAVGDIGMTELTGELERVLGKWRTSDSPRPVAGEAGQPISPRPLAGEGQGVRAAAQPRPTLIVLIDKPGAAQSVINVTLAGVQRTSPDYFPLIVMNTIYGGQFSSRLNMNLREQKGFTYGARSMFDWRVVRPGPFVTSTSVQTAVTAPALTEILGELKGMVGERPVADKELDFCRKYLTRGYTAGFETPSQVASQLETLVEYGLPDGYFNTVVPGITAVGADDVLRVAKRHLDLDRLVIVVVGDRRAVEPELRKLPVGKELSVLEFDDEFRLVPAKK